MLIVVALGGNALLQPHEALTAGNLLKNANNAALQIAKMANSHQVVLVHGNGPQVGLLALQSEAYHEVPTYPFDILNAESQGMIGYVLQQALRNALPHQEIVTLLSQVEVDRNDPAFSSPSKPIGPFYTLSQYQQLKAHHPDWQFQQNQQGFRRVIASPKPKALIELNTIQQLVQQHKWVIAGGGGGIPCIYQQEKVTGV